MGLDSSMLYAHLSEKALRREAVNERDVAAHFGVELGAVKKRFGLLTNHRVLEETEPGTYDCSGVLQCSEAAFESAGSQGKKNQAFVRGLYREIELLKANNEMMRTRLLTAEARPVEPGAEPRLVAA